MARYPSLANNQKIYFVFRIRSGKEFLTNRVFHSSHYANNYWSCNIAAGAAWTFLIVCWVVLSLLFWCGAAALQKHSKRLNSTNYEFKFEFSFRIAIFLLSFRFCWIEERDFILSVGVKFNVCNIFSFCNYCVLDKIL